ncbi:MAG: glycosyltransferase [Acidobacteria bacterium]|nr:glycosyltransferase [Acidobacteriota bacterium]
MTPAAPLPDLSVIVPAVNGIEILLECIEALRQAATDGIRIEILVVERCGESVRRHLGARAPDAVVLPVPPGTSIPRMRAVGFRQARAAAVAVIEDHVLVPADWAHKLLASLHSGADVVGGSVQNEATTTLVDRAAFLCEYSHLLMPVAGTGVRSLPGNNVVYRRARAAPYVALLDEGHWEDQFHQAMRRDGIALTSRPDIAVGHKMHYSMMDYLSQRFLYSRALAGMKRADMPMAERVLRAVGSFALPPILLARISRRVRASARHRRELVPALPLLAMFVGAWAAGEAVGYATGAGDAMARVR